MASEYRFTATRPTFESAELSDSEAIYSMCEEEPTQQDHNNRRLTQAMNYLNDEGGNDSRERFVSRVKCIDVALLQQLLAQGQAFDQKLYRQVHAMVSDVQRDYEDAVEEESHRIGSEGNLPEYYSPTATEALYRADDASPSPTPTPAPNSRAPATRRLVHHDDEQREREFRYGGPNNEVETWNKDFPASLPFPETFLMAHWESLKIDYDLSRLRNDSIVEADILTDHEHLQPYMKLSQYESGSRFKLPAVSKEDQIAISEIGDLQQAVNNFNQVDQSGGLTTDYAPRVSLENFAVGHQLAFTVVSPTRIRASLNVTPSKSRSARSSSTSTIPSKRSSPAMIEDCSYETDHVLVTHPPTDTPLEVRSPHNTYASESTTPKFPNSVGSAVRRLVKEVDKASGVQSATTPATSSARSTPTRNVAHVTIPKRVLGRPRMDSLAVEASPTPDTPVQQSLGKRKHGDGFQPYSPPKSSIKKVSRGAKSWKTMPQKTVGFVEPVEDGQDASFATSQVKSPTHGAAAGGRKVSKAAAAGKQAKKKGTIRVTGEKGSGGVGRGTTRSGAKYN